MRRIEIHLKDFVFIKNPKREFKEGLKAKKEKKRNEKNLNPPEGFCITFRIPKGNSKKV